MALCLAAEGKTGVEDCAQTGPIGQGAAPARNLDFVPVSSTVAQL